MAVVAPLLHAYVYGAVPPDAVAVAEPVLLPLQKAFILEMLIVIFDEAVITTEALPVQPFLSVTDTE